MKPSNWTLESYVAHNEAMREAENRLRDEIDRRYRDVDVEREKAVRIKEEADAQALQLARDIQTYKDMKANELREQIASERGLYATKNDVAALVDKFETMMKPVNEYIAADRGKDVGVTDNRALIVAIVTVISALILIGTFVFRGQNAPQQVIYVPSPAGTLLPTTPPQAPPR
jgi:hypothetical protein